MSRKRLSPSDEPHLLVRSTEAGLPHRFRIDRHRHAWHQLLYATSGLMTVETPVGHWVVPAQCAVWLPAEDEHSIRFSGTSELRTLYLRPSLLAPMPCRALSVTPLLRELIVRTVETHALDERVPVHRALATLLVEELRGVDAPPLALVRPRSTGLMRIVQLLDDPTSDALTSPQLARKLGVGSRTLERRFLAETGMTPFEWRRHARMLRALEQLLGGEPVKVAAERAGYATTSAFTAAFRATFGSSPRRYVARLVGA